MSRLYTVNQTKDYSIFEAHENNRNIKGNQKFKKLLKSMQKYGFLPFMPIWCKKTPNGKLSIQFGHHRFEAARKLNIPVCYMVYNVDFEIFAENETTNTWSLRDYLDCHVRDGDMVSLAIKKYHEETGISLSQCIGILGGHSDKDYDKSKAFKRKTFGISPESLNRADKIKKLVLHSVKVDKDIGKCRSYITALTKMVRVDSFDINTYISKLESNREMFVKQIDMDGYIHMIESIYNRRSQVKQPLAFMATEMTNNRNVGLK